MYSRVEEVKLRYMRGQSKDQETNKVSWQCAHGHMQPHTDE
jgi:hypothetical protein